MGNTRKLAVVGVAAAALVASVAASPVSANNGKGKGRDKLIQLQVLSFNDYHGHLEAPPGSDGDLGATLDPTRTLVGGSEFLSSKLSELRASAGNSVTVAAGDLIGGSTFLSGLFHDEPSVESLEALGLDVSSVGNHEFDEGLDELYRMQFGGCHPVDGCYFPEAPYDGAEFPWLAANVTFEDTGRTVLPPTWTKVVEGVKVGFIGMTLEGTPELVSAVGIQGLSFNDEVESANAAAARLQQNNVDSIVVLLHEGGAQAGKYDECVGISGPVVEIAENLDPAIDLVITGHTHQPYVCTLDDPAGNPRQVTSASSFGRVVTETWLTINKFTRDVVRSATTSVNHLVTRVNPDPSLTAIIQKWKTLSDPIGNRVVGTITEDITNPGNRQQETGMANLVADGLLAATAAPENGGAQIAVVNPGGVRASLSFAPPPMSTQQPGDVTYAEAYAVQPFGNFLVTMDLTGAQLKAMLEQQFFPRLPRLQLVLGVSNGLTFDWLQSAAQGSRVANVRYMGMPVDDTAVYRIATNNFLADGGDGFTVFRDGTNRISGVLDADGQVVDDLDALVNYITANSPLSSPGTNRINEIP
jgi:2',3'-cyclic-nucleotide 2'-phosphodiesterase (5'-nucleotidase family)